MLFCALYLTVIVGATPVLPPATTPVTVPTPIVSAYCVARRSLYTIVIACVATLFACSWSAYHPKVPTAKERQTHKLLGLFPYSLSLVHRIMWMFITVIAPEYVAIVAVDEYFKAKQIVLQSRESHTEISMEHAFFINMLGFVEPDGQICNAPDAPDDFIRLAAVEKDDITDKSKSDGLKKIILTGQILWFVVQFVARYFQAPIPKWTTPFEVFTVGIAALICIPSYFWLHKPLDVQRPIVLPPADMGISAGYTASDSPGDHLLASPLQGNLNPPTKTNPRGKKFITTTIQLVIGFIFGGLHGLAPNYVLPTPLERWLWLVLSYTSVATMYIFAKVDPDLTFLNFRSKVVFVCYAVSRCGLLVISFFVPTGFGADGIL